MGSPDMNGHPMFTYMHHKPLGKDVCYNMKLSSGHYSTSSVSDGK